MIFLFSFEAIEIAYTNQFDEAKHILVQQQEGGVSMVIKEGVKIIIFLQEICKVKYSMMMKEEDGMKRILQFPVFISFSPKGRKHTQHIYQLLCKEFQQHLLYFNLDQTNYKNVCFNRAILNERQICYGEGYSQLRNKQELRIAVQCLFNIQDVNRFIFLQKNLTEIKNLKKEGYNNILDTFDFQRFHQLLNKIMEGNAKENSKMQQQASQEIALYLKRFGFAKQYLTKLISKGNKQISLNQLDQFSLNQVKAGNILKKLFQPSAYYNMMPKSWTRASNSKQISSFVFKNVSDNRLYLARAEKPRQFAFQENYQNKKLSTLLSCIINPSGAIIPHDTLITFMKCCKIKSYENKKSFHNIRPYIEKLVTVNQMFPMFAQIESILRCGHLKDKIVHGIGYIIFISLLLNENLKAKPLFDQTALLLKNKIDSSIIILNKYNIQEDLSSYELLLCRIDFYDILDITTYKQFSKEITVSCNKDHRTFLLQDLHKPYLQEMNILCRKVRLNDLQYIKGICLYYGWQFDKTDSFRIIMSRLEFIQSFLQQIGFQEPVVDIQEPLLSKFPATIGLLIKEDYLYFIQKSKKKHYLEIETNEQNLSLNEQHIEKEQSMNPYMENIYKSSSFCIYNLMFPIHLFLQWIKSTGKYIIIEYISMINHNYEEYLILDKRIKLSIANDKKTGILIVDHAQLCPQLSERQRSCKTVFISRLSKFNIQNLTTISFNYRNQNYFHTNQDQISSLLFKNSNHLDFEFAMYFKIYEWVLSKYIENKCILYNLDFAQAIKFLSILHKEITTNRNRLSQIKQRYPKDFKYLYAYPICKIKQKVHLCNNIYPFLHVKYLFEKIVSNTWNFRLETKQNSSIVEWKNMIEDDIKEQIVLLLVDKLNSNSHLNKPNLQIKQEQNDILQLIRSLIKPNPQILDPIWKKYYPQKYYYSIFPFIVSTKNFQNLKDLQITEKHILMLSEDGIIIENETSNNSPLLSIKANESFISVDLRNKLYLVLESETNNIVCRKFDWLESGFQETVNIQICSEILLKNQSLLEFIQNIDFTPSPFTKLISLNQQLSFIKAKDKNLHIFNCKLDNNSKTTNKIVAINGQIKSLEIKNNNQIFCITTEQILIVKQENSNLIQSRMIIQPPLKTKDGLNCKIYDSNIKQEFFIIFYAGSLIQFYIFNQSQHICQKRNEYQLKKKIRAVQYSNKYIYLLFEGDQSLYIYERFENVNNQKGRKYYWVDGYCQDILSFGRDLYLRGGNSYLKKVNLDNPWLQS